MKSVHFSSHLEFKIKVLEKYAVLDTEELCFCLTANIKRGKEL